MSTRIPRLILALAASAAALVLLPAGASAAAIYHYSADLRAPNNSTSASAAGTIYVTDLSTSQNTGIAVRHGASPAFFTTTQGIGNSSFYSSDIIGLVPGDKVEVRQPSAAVTPTETYTIPAASATLTVGSGAVSGTVESGQLLELDKDSLCGNFGSESIRIGKTGGSFAATFKRATVAGGYLRIALYSDAGDVFTYYIYAPGEAPCLTASAVPSNDTAPGAPPSPKPYPLYLNGMSGSVAPDVKLVQLRGGSPIFTLTGGFGSMYSNAPVPALPGDRFEVYRPQGAPNPSTAFTIPQVSAIFDPSVDLVAIDAPASSHVNAYPCRQYTCAVENGRTLRNRPAGRSILDFTTDATEGSAFNLLPTDRVYAEYSDPSGTLTYEVVATVGDLAGPVASTSLPKSLRIGALAKLLNKGYKLKVTSNEAAQAKLSLSLGKTKLASVSQHVGAGTTTLKLKFTKSGKKAIKKLAAGKHAKSQSATLTALLTDAAGNASTLSKKTTIKR